MTPFEAATQLYQHTAENSAINDIGDEGRINAARAFQLLQQQKESALSIDRNKSELAERHRLDELDRIKLKNESASALYAKAKQYGFTPDTDKSLDENVAAATTAVNKQTLTGYKKVIGLRDQAQSEYMALLDKLGANKPIDKTRLNQAILNDPSLITFLNAADRAKLAAGTTPEELVNSRSWIGHGSSEASKTAILSAAQTARTTLQQEQQQVAAAKAGAAGKLLESKFDEHNQMGMQILKSLPPEMIGDALDIGAPASGGPLGGQKLTTDNLLPGLAGPGATAAVTTPPLTSSDRRNDPVLGHIDIAVAKNLFEDAETRKSDAKARVDDLSAKIMAGDSLPADQRAELSTDYLKAKKDLEKATDDSKTALKQGSSTYNALKDKTGTADFFQSIGYYPGGKRGGDFPPIVPVDPATQNGGYSGPGQPNRFQPVPMIAPQPSAVPPANQPAAPPNAASPTNSPGAQIDPMKMRDTQNQIQRALGVSDPQTLYAAHNYAKTQLGMDDDAINSLLKAVVSGDQTAIQQAKAIVSQVSAPADNFAAPTAYAASAPPAPAYA